MEKLRIYFYNCFLLTVPVIIWNVLMTKKLPAVFQPEIFGKDIPFIVSLGENTFRLIFFVFCFLMPLPGITDRNKRAWAIYVAGILLYVISWLVLIYLPYSAWSNSLTGQLAPALTPLIWMAGIVSIGKGFLAGLPLRRWHLILVCFLFLAFHNAHALIVLTRNAN